MNDWRGLPLTRAGDAERIALDDFSQGLLGYEPRAAHALAAADAAPDCPLLQASAAMLHMFMETRDAPNAARPYMERAEAAAADATPRERLVIAAARAWVDGNVEYAIALGEQAAREFPRDLALAKVTQYHLFNRGDLPGMLRVALAVLPANADVAHAHGMAAFGWEECHRLADAERAARTALDMQPSEPWAQHALAHVLLTQGRNDEGRAFLEGAKDGWAGLNSFMHTHNWWHLALVQIEQGDAAGVLDYFDAHIWGVWPEYSQDQLGAVSLLARLELVGTDVGERWASVAAYLCTRVDDHVQPFLSMHYLYGLARAGRDEADAMLEAIRRTAVTARPSERPAWSEVCAPACEGLLAHARGDARGAVRALGPVMGRMREVGGSHAQRDLFEQVFTDALARGGDLVGAEQALAQRLLGNPHSRPTRDRLDVVHRALGLGQLAADRR